MVFNTKLSIKLVVIKNILLLLIDEAGVLMKMLDTSVIVVSMLPSGSLLRINDDEPPSLPDRRLTIRAQIFFSGQIISGV